MPAKSTGEVEYAEIGVATKLLNEVKSIEFPTEMCPLGAPPAAQ